MKHPQELMDRLPDGVHNVVSRICVPLMPYKHPICSSPSLSHRAHTLIFWLGNKEVDLFGSVQHSLGSWTLPHCSQLPLWEKSQAKKLSLGTELWHLRGRVAWTKWNCSFSLLGFFLLLCCAGSCSLETCISTKAILSIGNCLNWCSLGKDGRKLLLCHVDLPYAPFALLF